MLVTRKSQISGKEHTLDLDVTAGQIVNFYKNSDEVIQKVFPQLTPSEREFLITGVTDEEWESVFGCEQ